MTAATRRIALARLLARREGFLEARVEGTSMGVTLPVGSLIRLRPGREREFDPGDVVAVVVEEKIVVHRVVRVIERGPARSRVPSSEAIAGAAAHPGGEGARSAPRVQSPVSVDEDPRPRARPGAALGVPGPGPSDKDPRRVVTLHPAGDRSVSFSEPRTHHAREVLLLTRGDGRILPDPPWPAAWVLGPVVEVRTGEGTWRPVGPAPRRSPLRALVASGAAGWIGALARVNPTLAVRAARSMLIGAHLARSVLTWDRKGRHVGPAGP